MQSGDHHTSTPGVGIIPANTQLQTSLSVTTGDGDQKPYVKLLIQVLLNPIAIAYPKVLSVYVVIKRLIFFGSLYFAILHLEDSFR